MILITEILFEFSMHDTADRCMVHQTLLSLFGGLNLSGNIEIGTVKEHCSSTVNES